MSLSNAWGFISVWQNFEPTLVKLLLGQLLNGANGQIYKNRASIWSHCKQIVHFRLNKPNVDRKYTLLNTMLTRPIFGTSLLKSRNLSKYYFILCLFVHEKWTNFHKSRPKSIIHVLTFICSIFISNNNKSVCVLDRYSM